MVTIKDNVLSPFIIEIDELNTTVYEIGKNKDGNETKKVVGYYTQLENALKKIESMKRDRFEKEFTLKAYVEYIGKVKGAFLVGIQGIIKQGGSIAIRYKTKVVKEK